MDKFVVRTPRDGDDVAKKTVSNKPRKKQTTIEALSVRAHFLSVFFIKKNCYLNYASGIKRNAVSGSKHQFMQQTLKMIYAFTNLMTLFLN